VTARVAAQAKINLFLRVLAREQSGYHQIETLFCRLDLADDVVVRVTPAGRSIDCRLVDATLGDVGPTEHNLAYRAAVSYATARDGWPHGFAIEIDKRIPIGAGLGGGSADAGAVFRALQALDPDPLPTTTVLALARQLGADVPFFATDAALALAWGRGDRLLPCPPLPPRHVLLCVPPVAVSTRDAYAWLAAARGDAVAGPVAFPRRAFAGWEEIEPYLGNDFQPIVAARHPEIADALETLERIPGVYASQLTGSGSAVYALTDRPAPDTAARPPSPERRAMMLRTMTAAHVVAVERME
jgi:4-diphosphocytidyl-2-C-methyl-D-erythritol kinase